MSDPHQCRGRGRVQVPGGLRQAGEAFTDGQGSSAAARSPLNMLDVRNKLDKFIKALGPNELQVCDIICLGTTLLL